MSEAEHEATGEGRARYAGAGPESGGGSGRQTAAGHSQAEAGARGEAPQQLGPATAEAVHGQPGAYAPQNPSGYPPQHPPYYQPQPQQPAYAQGGYGHPYPGGPVDPALGASGYSGAYAPYYYAGYPPAAFHGGYPAGAMPGQAAPMGGYAAAAMANPLGAAAPGAGAQAGAGQGPGPQAGMQQLFEELAEGGNGLNSLTRILSLDDTEFWKGALVGAAAVLLLTNEQVQDALFKSGAKAKSAVKSGADKMKERASASSETENDS